MKCIPIIKIYFCIHMKAFTKLLTNKKLSILSNSRVTYICFMVLRMLTNVFELAVVSFVLKPKVLHHTLLRPSTLVRKHARPQGQKRCRLAKHVLVLTQVIKTPLTPEHTSESTSKIHILFAQLTVFQSCTPIYFITLYVPDI